MILQMPALSNWNRVFMACQDALEIMVLFSGCMKAFAGGFIVRTGCWGIVYCNHIGSITGHYV